MADKARVFSLGNLAAAAVLVFIGFVAGRMTSEGGAPESTDEDRFASLEKQRRAVIQFEVGRGMSLLKPQPDFDESAWEVFKQTQVAYLKSPFVLRAALGANEGEIAQLPLLKEVEDQVEWLRDHLVIGFPEDSQILEIALVHPQGPEQDLRTVVEAVGKAYFDEVVFVEGQRRRLPLQLMKKRLIKLEEALGTKRDQLASMVRNVGDDAPTDSDLIAQEKEIENLQAVLDRLSQRVATEEIEAQAPNRIRAIGSNHDGSPSAETLYAE